MQSLVKGVAVKTGEVRGALGWSLSDYNKFESNAL